MEEKNGRIISLKSWQRSEKTIPSELVKLW
jgi:hypothetical protein